MRLSHLTLTGADDAVDPGELVRLSAEAPLIEWGVLFNEGAADTTDAPGRPRFPSRAWRKAFAAARLGVRRAAHLCGAPLLGRLAAADDGVDALVRELTGADAAYQRLQLNFTSPDLPAAVLDAWVAASRSGRWSDGDGRPLTLITQHNKANEHVHEHFLHSGAPTKDRAADHAVLFDASGGHGVSPAIWPPLLARVRCGYAGGLDAQRLPEALSAIGRAVGSEATVWIDIETGLRSDDRFDLDRVRAVLATLRELADGASLQPGLRIDTASRATTR